MNSINTIKIILDVGYDQDIHMFSVGIRLEKDGLSTNRIASPDFFRSKKDAIIASIIWGHAHRKKCLSHPEEYCFEY